MRNVEEIRQELQKVQNRILDLTVSTPGYYLIASEEYQDLAAQRDALQCELLELETERVFGSYYTRACDCACPEIISAPGNRPGTCRCGGLVKNRPLEYEVDEGEYDYRPSPQEWAKIGLYAIVGLILIYIILVGLGVAK